jgi:hypothetical protein
MAKVDSSSLNRDVRWMRCPAKLFIDVRPIGSCELGGLSFRGGLV